MVLCCILWGLDSVGRGLVLYFVRIGLSKVVVVLYSILCGFCSVGRGPVLNFV